MEFKPGNEEAIIDLVQMVNDSTIIQLDTPKMLAALAAVACGAYISKECYEIWKEHQQDSTEWIRKHSFVRPPAYDNYPDLSLHNSAMASCLTPEIYEVLKHKKTIGGFTLEKAIQIGIDCPGKPWERKSGIIAGDTETYQVFSLLFDKIIYDLHEFRYNDIHTKEVSLHGIYKEDFDSKYVRCSRMTVLRSLKGYRLPAASTRQERRNIEHVVRLALCRFKGDHRGEYYGINDLTDSYKKRLSARTLLPDPTSPILACSGRARDWPDARGIFISQDKSFLVLVNECDHMKIVCMNKDSRVLATFRKLYRGVALLEEELRRNNEEFAWSDHLGYIVSDPINLGTALDISIKVRLRRLSVDNRLNYILNSLELKRTRKGIESINIAKGEFYVYTDKTLGVTEVQILQILLKGVTKLIQLEMVLEKGDDIEDILPKRGYGHNQINCSAADIVTSTNA